MYDDPNLATPSIDELFEFDREIIGRDTSKRRRDTDKVPFRYICQLTTEARVTTAKGTFRVTGHGTGTLIAPRTVLTAAHNLVLTKDQLVEAGALDPGDSFDPRLSRSREVTVRPGRDGANEPFPSAKGRRRFFFNGFLVKNAAGRVVSVRNGSAKDLAIVQVGRNYSGSAGHWGEARRSGDSTGTSITTTGALPLATGTLKVNLSGYPNDPRKPAGTQWSSFDLTVRRGSISGTEGLLLYLNDTLSGHSGSPVWVKRHSSKGGRVLVGVHVGAVSRRANVAVHLTADHIAFINRHKR